MGMVRTLGIVVLLTAGTAVANTVTLTAEVGGDNHAADLKNNVFTLFTPGTTADGQQFDIGSGVLTWAIHATLTGTSPGIANLVCDVELKVGDENGPTANADFISTVHDLAGSSCADFSGGSLAGHCGRDASGQADSDESVCDPCFASAAFAYAYNTNGLGPARMIDQNFGDFCGTTSNPSGGPNMGVFLYPTCEPGKLFGVGGGFPHYKATGVTTLVRPYIGVYPNPADGSIGYTMPQSSVPLIEGQIDLTNLSAGTYTLVVTPGEGINVLRDDITLTQDQPSFAVPADTKIGDTITFELIDIPDTFELVTAASRCTHGATDWDIPLSLSGGPNIEPREGPQEIVLTFNEDVAATDGTLNAGQEVIVSDGTIDSITVNGPEMVIAMSGLSAGHYCLNVQVAGLESALTGAPLSGDDDVDINVLTGDVNGSLGVTVIDLSEAKVLVVNGGAVNGSNFMMDVNCSGGFTITDLSVIKTGVGNTVLCP